MGELRPKPIDVHVHPSTAEQATYTRQKLIVRSIDQTADEYREWGLQGVLIAVDPETATGLPAIPNDIIAEAKRKHPDVFVRRFGSVDPWKGKMALKEIERCILDLGLDGIKFQQAMQAFFPNDPRFFPLYERCVELGAYVIFHTGYTGFGAGTPGGRGVKLKYVRPIYLDDVAAEFPELVIIGAHPSWPWQEEILAVAWHKANVYIDLSGWSPKYFSPSLVHYANTLLKDKVMFGSDYPLITPKRWLEDFEEAGFREESQGPNPVWQRPQPVQIRRK